MHDTIEKLPDQPAGRAELGRGAVPPAVHRGPGGVPAELVLRLDASPRTPASPRSSARSALRRCRISRRHERGRLGGYQYGVNAWTQNRDAALDFLHWLSPPETQLRFATQLGLAPTRQAVFDEPALATAQPFMQHAEAGVRRRHAAAGHAEISAGHAGPAVRGVARAGHRRRRRRARERQGAASRPSSRPERGYDRRRYRRPLASCSSAPRG